MFEIGKTDHWWEIAKRHESLSNHPNTLKPLGYAHIVNLIENFKPQRVLEVGHGAMSFIFQIFSEKIEMWGLDDVIEDSSVYEQDLKNVRIWNPKVKFVKDLLGRFSKELPDNYFDLVYSVSVIEHIPHEILPSVFEDSYRILKPGGILSHSYDVYYKQSTKEVFNAYEKAGFKWLKPRETMNVFWEEGLGKLDNELVDEMMEKIVFENPMEVAEKYMWQQERKYRNSPINFVTVLNAGVKPANDADDLKKDINISNFKDQNHNLKEFTFSKKSHMKFFSENNYDELLFGNKIDINYCDLKVYQNFLIYAYLINNLTPGAKILEIGDNVSQVTSMLKSEYECWNVRLNKNAEQKEIEGINSVNSLFNDTENEIPLNYFDLVFSCSVFGQENPDNAEMIKKIPERINSFLKNNAMSIQTFVLLYKDPLIWKPEILDYLYETQKAVNEYIPMMKLIIDEDLYTMSEKFYTDNWEMYTTKSFRKFGKPLSYNLFWKK